MKAVLIALICVLGLTACGNDAGDTDSKPPLDMVAAHKFCQQEQKNGTSCIVDDGNGRIAEGITTDGYSRTDARNYCYFMKQIHPHLKGYELDVMVPTGDLQQPWKLIWDCTL